MIVVFLVRVSSLIMFSYFSFFFFINGIFFPPPSLFIFFCLRSPEDIFAHCGALLLQPRLALSSRYEEKACGADCLFLYILFLLSSSLSFSLSTGWGVEAAGDVLSFTGNPSWCGIASDCTAACGPLRPPRRGPADAMMIVKMMDSLVIEVVWGLKL